MDINKKINKLDKLIINNNEILNIKYKERNDILENYSNKPQEYIIHDLDKYIDELEDENKKIEKKIEELKKVENINLNDNLTKTQLCKYYKTSSCNKGINCNFAHNEKE